MKHLEIHTGPATHDDRSSTGDDRGCDLATFLQFRWSLDFTAIDSADRPRRFQNAEDLVIFRAHDIDIAGELIVT